MQLHKQGGIHGPLLTHLCNGHQLCKCKREWEPLKIIGRCIIAVNYIRDTMNMTLEKKKLR